MADRSEDARRLPVVGWALLPAVISIAACGSEAGTGSWSFGFEDAALRERAVRVEATIRRGGCTDTQEAIYSVIAPVAGDAAPPPELGPGRYAFSGRAIDRQCRWYAAGCTDVALPTDRGRPVLVNLRGIAEIAECAAATCSEGRCGGTADDAGGPVCPNAVGDGFGAMALYTFSGLGMTPSIADRSGVAPCADLTTLRRAVLTGDGVDLGQGGLFLDAAINAMMRERLLASSISLETWITSADAAQGTDAAAWVVGFAESNRAVFALEQRGEVFSFTVDRSGSPSTQPAAADTRRHHVVLTYDAAVGTQRIYLDGSLVSGIDLGAGDLLTGNQAAGFGVGARPMASRGWNGVMHFLALYDRALSESEVLTQYARGPAR